MPRVTVIRLGRMTTHMQQAISRRIVFLAVTMLSAFVCAAEKLNDQVPSPSTSNSRSFVFTYAATVNGLQPGAPTRVWLPIPCSDETQQIEQLKADVPAGASTATEPRFGNRILSLILPRDHGSTATFSITYKVTRHEALPSSTCPVPASATMSDAAALLRPDARVPVGGEPADTLIANRPLPADPALTARILYDVVDDHLQYRKDKPGWGTGDATWACRSGFGNCTDFHSLFISLARTEKLPAVFQIGFPVGEESSGEVKGYHCWAWVKDGANWSPVDISEANQHPAKRDYYFGRLDANRVAFSVGRDLELVPKQAGPPLNFFVYPYVEENGKPVPQERIAKAMKYRSNQ